MKRKSYIFFLIFIMGFLYTWEYVAQRSPAICLVCPAPSKIFFALLQTFPILFREALITLKGMLGGFFVAMGFAITCALVMNRFKKSKSFFQPLFVLIQCIPLFTLAPLIVLWFGWGLQAVIIPNALMIFFPLTLTISQGLESVPEDFKEFFIIHQATYYQTLVKLRLPFAIPHIFSGLKIAAAAAGFGTVAGEWVVGNSGLGILILESRRNYEMEVTFATLVVLGILTISFYSIILCLEQFSLSAFRIYKKPRTSSKKRLKPRVAVNLILFSIFAPVLFLIASSSSFIANLPQNGLQKVDLLLDWIPNINHVPLYVGINKKIFEKQGIHLVIKKGCDGGNGFPHLLFQKVDLILQSTSGAIRAALKNKPIQIIGNLINTPLGGLICRDDGIELHDVSELSGKILGLCLGNQDISILINDLKEHRIIPSQIKNVSTDLIAPLVLKKIDFLYGAFWNIEGSKLEALGLKLHIFQPSSYGIPDMPQLVVIAKKDTLFSSETFVTRFRLALEESINFCRENPEKALEIFWMETPQNKAIQKQTRDQWQKTLPLLPENQDKINEMVIKDGLQWITRQNHSFEEAALSFRISDIQPF